MKQLLAQLTSIWTEGTPTQRVLGVLSVFVVALGVGASAYLSTRPDFALLFGNLEPTDGAEVVERVREAGVEVRIEDGGRSILVPREKVAELRMLVSAAGLPRGGSKGWELFDGSAFGVSEFVQNVNLRRALEGELARSIRSFDAVDDATVKISAPRRSPFVGQDRKAKASVVVTPRAGRALALENVQAIEHLVAGAVEGLEVDQVRVLDTRGRVLSQTQDDPLTAAASTQMDYRLKREEERRNTAQEMLDRMGVVADVRVALELDFQQVSETSERFEPTGTVLSETLDNQSTKPATVSNGGPAGSEAKIDGTSALPSSAALTEETKETITSTYGVGKTVRSQQRLAPEVKRISVSLVVHDEHADRMSEIEEQVKAAVGFVEGRDVIRSMAHAFKLPEEEPAEVEAPSTMVRDVAERVIQVVAILGALYLVLRILRTVERRHEATTAEGAAGGAHEEAGARTEAPAAVHASEPDDEVLESPRVEDMVRQSVERDPASAARVLRSWLHEGEPN